MGTSTVLIKLVWLIWIACTFHKFKKSECPFPHIITAFIKAVKMSSQTPHYLPLNDTSWKPFLLRFSKDTGPASVEHNPVSSLSVARATSEHQSKEERWLGSWITSAGPNVSASIGGRDGIPWPRSSLECWWVAECCEISRDKPAALLLSCN